MKLIAAAEEKENKRKSGAQEKTSRRRGGKIKNGVNYEIFTTFYGYIFLLIG
ncbi:MAG: hypothetical protein JW833_11210 [Prolixibacteraceae bacterium]|nr:hypothetical protein [Prolixibacteraceae bacterium]